MKQIITEELKIHMVDIVVKNLRTEKPTHPWDVKVDRSSWFWKRNGKMRRWIHDS